MGFPFQSIKLSQTLERRQALVIIAVCGRDRDGGGRERDVGISYVLK